MEIYAFDENCYSETYINNIKAAYSATVAEHEALDDYPDPPMTLDDIMHEVPYEEGQKIIKNSLHCGQLKLLLGAVSMITRIATPKTKYILYVGAAPGIASAYFTILFPQYKFILIDPAKFHIKVPTKYIYYLKPTDPVTKCVSGKQQIYVIQRFMTDALAQEFVEAGVCGENCLFISDIRTDSEGNSLPDCVDILWNLAQQYNWMCILKPYAAMNKFRHPFYVDADKFLETVTAEPYHTDFVTAKQNGIDFIQNFHTRTLTYVQGTVDLQVWAPVSSTETRLVTVFGDKNPTEMLHDYGTPAVYEAKLCYYNNVLRSRFIYNNPYRQPSIGFDRCVECAIEAKIWEAYAVRFQGMDIRMRLHNRSIIETYAKKAMEIIGRDRITDHHGEL
jgi:hypothetical protein